jgi:hypothetical protein
MARNSAIRASKSGGLAPFACARNRHNRASGTRQRPCCPSARNQRRPKVDGGAERHGPQCPMGELRDQQCQGPSRPADGQQLQPAGRRSGTAPRSSAPCAAASAGTARPIRCRPRRCASAAGRWLRSRPTSRRRRCRTRPEPRHRPRSAGRRSAGGVPAIGPLGLFRLQINSIAGNPACSPPSFRYKFAVAAGVERVVARDVEHPAAKRSSPRHRSRQRVRVVHHGPILRRKIAGNLGGIKGTGNLDFRRKSVEFSSKTRFPGQPSSGMPKRRPSCPASSPRPSRRTR